jgi:acetyl esterase/lipase
MKTILILIALITINYANAQSVTDMPLYKGPVPNSTNAPDNEKLVFASNVLRYARVSVPTITMFKPTNPNGKAIIICPGGGYAILAFDKEGTKVAETLAKQGYTAFVLKSRLPNDTFNIDRSLAPLQDAQQAIRMVRSRADEFKINKNQIGIMGFSAGGHLASTAATHFNRKADVSNTDTTSTRPDFAILIYPVISMDSTITHRGSRNNLIGAKANQQQTDLYSNDLQVTANTPPSFIVHAADDATVPLANSLRYIAACSKFKVPIEAHIYPRGGHGFGMNNTTTDDVWMDRLFNWLKNIK